MYRTYRNDLNDDQDLTDTDENPFSDVLIGEDDNLAVEEEGKSDKDTSGTSLATNGTKRKQHHKDIKATPKKTKNKIEREAKTFPNYLIAIQISNPKIQAAIQAVQEHVVAQNENFKKILNKPVTLHMTMFMAHLDTEDDFTRAYRALDLCQVKLRELYLDHLLHLDICGIGNFRNSVVFAKVKPGEQVEKLQEIADIVEECFLQQNLQSTLEAGFSPHITFMNMSKCYQLKKIGIKKIHEALYEDYIDAEFGHQTANTLQLLPMMKPKAESGYYPVEYSVQFGPDIPDDEAVP